MPLYEFVCSECAAKTERLLPSVVEKIECPRCGAPARKVFSTFRKGKSSGIDSFNSPSSSSGGCSGCTSSSCSGC